jgi:plasmid stabilization system protein ParE
MEIRWSKKASEDFTAIIQYIRRENPDAALRSPVRSINDLSN